MPAVIVIGAGIGGLSLALELHARGYACQVFEAASAVQAAGVGLNIQPYAARELHRLGLASELRQASMLPCLSVYASSAGQILLSEPLGIAGGFEFPQYSIHRAALQHMLLNAVHRRLGADAVRFGHRLVRVEQDAREARAYFDCHGTPARGDMLVGCDGIHSAVCRQLHPVAARIRQSGIVMWRGVTRHFPLLDQQTMLRCGRIETGKLVAYPVRDPDAPDALLANWVLELRDDSEPGEHHAIVAPTSVPAVFLSWKFDWLDVRSLILNAAQVLRMPMTDRDPLPRWSHRRITLLGDAAHPMYPVGSNGAGQAILDAAALAASIDGTDVITGLRTYDALRRRQAAAIVARDRAGGPDIVLEAIHAVTNDVPATADDMPALSQRLSTLLTNYRAGHA
ncbi:FAD-dependent monooxygenase [Burkholderia sp. Ac-20344]|uniref:FAD-dependent monooxygenase n=1 Tax=Burkholderia sp. Ac-20344 TaxID=2703890 RepID=UPI00197C45D2|nr:FAD-dependent monooxygenase [Burkholderia sp. Ac-20344]MBN3834982.1 flavin-dependent oxidoreductase [Burkholderia sp. Ac-20344]